MEPKEIIDRYGVDVLELLQRYTSPESKSAEEMADIENTLDREYRITLGIDEDEPEDEIGMVKLAFYDYSGVFLWSV